MTPTEGAIHIMAEALSELIARKAALLQEFSDLQADLRQVYADHQRTIDEAQAKLRTEHKRIVQSLHYIHELIEKGDWVEQLRAIAADPDMTRPKFQFNQRVFRDYTHSVTGEVFRDLGVVKGLVHNKPEYSPGWWYWVDWRDLPSSPWIKLPHMEPCTEDELYHAPTLSLARFLTLRDS